MRGIQSTWGDPDSFSELLSVTKADPNNFLADSNLIVSDNFIFNMSVIV